MNYKILNDIEQEQRIQKLAKELYETKDVLTQGRLNEDLVLMEKYAVENGSELWKALGNSSVTWRDDLGLEWKRVDDFVLRNGIIRKLDVDKNGKVTGIIENRYVRYDEAPVVTKKMVEKSTKKALKDTIENAAKASASLGSEGIITPFNTEAQNKLEAQGNLSNRERRLLESQSQLLGLTLGQDVMIDVVLSWTDVAGGKQATTSRVRVQNGQSISGATNTWLRDQQDVLPNNEDFDFSLSLYSRETGALVGYRTGVCRKGSIIKI